jgi:hypothetical protein
MTAFARRKRRDELALDGFRLRVFGFFFVIS